MKRNPFSKSISRDPIGLTDHRPSSFASLPIKHDLRSGYRLSLLIAGLTAVASSAGLLITDDIYTTAEQQKMFVANDAVNLVIGLPILIGSMWLAWRGRLIGLLFWPGALFYGLYNYLVYLFAMPFDVAFCLYLAIVTLSIYTTISLVSSIEGEAVKQRLNGRVPERFGGAILIAFGILFALRTISMMAAALISQAPIVRPELALLVVDFLFAPALIVVGVQLWRRQALGYVGGAGLLFQASMLFVGLIAILILQPLMSEAPFMLTDVIVVFVMGFVCFVPFALFIRGVIIS